MARTTNTRAPFRPTVATFKKHNGKWTVMVPSAMKVMSGDAVPVHKANGAIVTEVLGDRVGWFYGYALFAIAPVGDNTHPVIACAGTIMDEDPDALAETSVESTYTEPEPANVQRADDPIPSTMFVYDPNTRTFVAEASDLQAYNTGNEIRMISAKTGAIATFAYRRVDRDAEGEVTAWEYACDALGLRLHVLND